MNGRPHSVSRRPATLRGLLAAAALVALAGCTDDGPPLPDAPPSAASSSTTSASVQVRYPLSIQRVDSATGRIDTVLIESDRTVLAKVGGVEAGCQVREAEFAELSQVDTQLPRGDVAPPLASAGVPLYTFQGLQVDDPAVASIATTVRTIVADLERPAAMRAICQS